MRLVDIEPYDEMGGYIHYEYSRHDNNTLTGTILTKEIHTINAKPIVYGTWNQQYQSGQVVREGYVSSCCDMWNNRKSHFCPSCGAEMINY